jgi:hypothetical protein
MLTRRTALAAGMSALATPAFGQNAPPDPQKLFTSEGRYIPFWSQLLETPSVDAFLPQFASAVGDEVRALQRAGRDSGETLSAEAIAAPALASIVEAARDRQIVFLNEAHNASRHRSFLAALLRALRPLGFTHLAAETFANFDPKAIAALGPGSAITPRTGPYLWDPVFAEAVREALELGYRLVPYETTGRIAPDASRDHRIAAREEAQALNFIANGLKAAPAGRFLVYVGYSHLREAPDREGHVWFAKRLKEKTGIDPLTIEQSFTGSFGPHGQDRALTRAVLERFQPTAPILVRDGAAWLGAEEAGADMAVFHPSLPDVRGRPGWLAADPMRRFHAVAIPAATPRPLLVQALHSGDPDNAIPADHVLAPAGAREAALLLRPGRYRLRLETLEGFTPLGEAVVG